MNDLLDADTVCQDGPAIAPAPHADWLELHEKYRRRLFAFAGLFTGHRDRQDEFGTCAIVTTRANALIAPFGGRMPAILAPEDVKSIGPDVLRHRIILTYEAEAQAVTTDDIIKRIFNTIPVP